MRFCLLLLPLGLFLNSCVSKQSSSDNASIPYDQKERSTASAVMNCNDLYPDKGTFSGIKAMLEKALRKSDRSAAEPRSRRTIDVRKSTFDSAEKVALRMEGLTEENLRTGLNSRPLRPVEFAIEGNQSLVVEVKSNQKSAKDFYEYIINAHARGELIPFMTESQVFRIEINFSFAVEDSMNAPANTFRSIYTEIVVDKNGDLVIASYEPNVRPIESRVMIRLGKSAEKSVEELRRILTRFFENPRNGDSNRSVSFTAKNKVREILGADLDSIVKCTESGMAIDLLNSLGYEFNPTDSENGYWAKVATAPRTNALLAALRKIKKQKLFYVSHGFDQMGLYKANEIPSFFTPLVGGGLNETGRIMLRADRLQDVPMYKDIIAKVKELSDEPE